MKIKFKTVIQNPSLLISTGFGIGLIPFAPGTFGSGVGLCLYIFLAHFTQETIINSVLIYCMLLAISLFVVHQSIKQLGNKDHQEIVIDEFVGQMIPLLAIPIYETLYPASKITQPQEGNILNATHIH